MTHYGLRYARDGVLILHGYVDFEWVGDVGDDKSTSTCCFSWV
jgi:hypothetical protein